MTKYIDHRAISKIAADHAEVEVQLTAADLKRTCQYDADFAAYHCAVMDESLSENLQRFVRRIEGVRRAAKCGFINAFLTLGEKTGREGVATVKPYQQDRETSEKKERVRALRMELVNNPNTLQNGNVVYDHFYEADDLMIRYQHEAIRKEGWDSTVLVSNDKDLWMAMGNHCDEDGDCKYVVKGYGKTEYKEVGNKKPKLVGQGRSWFWHQMIMGDKADDIPGLEKIDNMDLDVYMPLKSGKPRKDGNAAAGEAKAVSVLETAENDIEACIRVIDLYYNYYGADWSSRFIEQAYLLWMQRTENPWDVLEYFKKVCNIDLKPNNYQLRAVEAWQERRRNAILLSS